MKSAILLLCLILSSSSFAFWSSWYKVEAYTTFERSYRGDRVVVEIKNASMNWAECKARVWGVTNYNKKAFAWLDKKIVGANSWGKLYMYTNSPERFIDWKAEAYCRVLLTTPWLGWGYY